MKTIAYSDIANRAAELAGRTRDKIPLSEATILQAMLATDLEDLWNKQVWPELTPDPVQVTVTNRLFSKQEGLAGEMGDIITILSANPRITSRYRPVGFEERDDAVWIDENLASVWVEYMLPAPDLMLLSGTTLATYAVPRRFRSYLSFRGAGALLNCDDAGKGTGLWAIAETALATQVARLPAVPEWRQVRPRVGWGRIQQPIAVQQA